MYWVVGYNLMYDGVDGGYIGSFLPKVIPDPGADAGDYAAASDWFFQMVFCATAASIVSGTLAERIKLWPFLIFVAILTAASSTRSRAPGNGARAGFRSRLPGLCRIDDRAFHRRMGGTRPAPSSWAHAPGSTATRTAPSTRCPGSSMPLATLGTFILWLGWFGFNGGSQLALGSLEDASSVSRIFMNTNIAAAAGVVVAMILSQVFYGKVDLTFALNGALAGLVSITAEPLTPSPIWAIIIGGIGGAIVVFTVPLLDKMKIDDVVGAIPVHLVAGIWGTLAVPFTNSDSNFGAQILGIVSIGVFVTVASLIVWMILKVTIGIRPTEEQEANGLDQTECGMEAYPEFGVGSQRI